MVEGLAVFPFLLWLLRIACMKSRFFGDRSGRLWWRLWNGTRRKNLLLIKHSNIWRFFSFVRVNLISWWCIANESIFRRYMCTTYLLFQMQHSFKLSTCYIKLLPPRHIRRNIILIRLLPSRQRLITALPIISNQFSVQPCFKQWLWKYNLDEKCCKRFVNWKSSITCLKASVHPTVHITNFVSIAEWQDWWGSDFFQPRIWGNTVSTCLLGDTVFQQGLCMVWNIYFLAICFYMMLNLSGISCRATYRHLLSSQRPINRNCFWCREFKTIAMTTWISWRFFRKSSCCYIKVSPPYISTIRWFEIPW